ncbi:MAG: 3-hydroxyacyl-CoA dehydrogenase family protein [Firmicutes bacterium]|nr:3-hydroxyacyl-CoA dehydrogenase family protein [Bacillota bacterium]MBR4164948.1 3-hydroxyacyl-CoA dehydrogenase family protein [Lachnospiraceae bacterium]
MKSFEEIKKILICGGGLMGKNIAFVMTANPNYQVTVYDLYPTDVEAGIRKSTAQLVEGGYVKEEELVERLSRIYFTTNMDDPAIADADLVIEAVFEDMGVKQETFAKLEARMREDAYFCTNSSVMSPSEISSKLTHRERFVGTHFWNPGHLIPLVEVIKTDATADGVAETVMEVLSSVGKKPCLCKKDVPGFIANRLQHALWREAISIVEHGIADAATVDTAIKNSFGLRLPQLSALENSDLVGTQLTWNIHNYVLPHIEDSHEPSPLLKKMLDEGKMGFKSGEGFYKWTQEEIDKCNADLNAYLIKMLYQ